MNNDEFWAIAKSQEFIDKFYGEHPLYQENGGVDFYDPDRLRKLLHDRKKKLLRQSKGRNQYVYRNSVKVIESWLRQAEWIFNQSEQ